MLFGKKACDQRETALHDLLSYARSFDLRLDQCRSLAINEFEGNPRINRDVTRDQPQADSDTRRVEHRWVSLSAVDCAFERLRQGRYGFCEACGNEISLARLKIAPCALYCVDCQHKRKDLLDAADHHSDEPLSSMAMEPCGIEQHRKLSGPRWPKASAHETQISSARSQLQSHTEDQLSERTSNLGPHRAGRDEENGLIRSHPQRTRMQQQHRHRDRWLRCMGICRRWTTG